MDTRITPEDIDNIEDAIANFAESFRTLVNVCDDMNGDCNEIISQGRPWRLMPIEKQDIPTRWCVGSLDDVFHIEFNAWLKMCYLQIKHYREFFSMVPMVPEDNSFRVGDKVLVEHCKSTLCGEIIGLPKPSSEGGDGETYKVKCFLLGRNEEFYSHLDNITLHLI